MKIGELSLKYHISKDTIRYYVEKGLLLPDTHSAQMKFSEREADDLEEIIRLKNLSFTIHEIQAVLNLRRMSNLIEPDTIQAYLKILQDKMENIHQKQMLLEKASQAIEEEIRICASREKEISISTGVPLVALQYLVCPLCGKKLKISQASMTDEYLDSGKLDCSCGYHADIINGIVDTGNRYPGSYDHPDEKRGLYRNVGDEFIVGFQKSSDMVSRSLEEMNLHDKIIMETNINGYFFLYNNCSRFRNDCLYIITDKYPQMLLMYKHLIELMHVDAHILYIADAGVNYPIQKGIVHVLLDFYGSNEHFLYHKHNFLNMYKKYLQPEGTVIGVMMGFHNGAASLKKVPLKYPECSDLAMNLDLLLEAYKAEGFTIAHSPVARITHTYDQYSFSCHLDGDFLEIMYSEAKRGV